MSVGKAAFAASAGAALLIVGAAGGAAAGAPSAGAPSAAARPALTRIAGNVLPSLGQLPSVAADPAAAITVGVALARPHPAAEDEFLRAQADPTSPDFGRVLTLAQVVARFGVPAARTGDVVTGLQNSGLVVQNVDATGDYVYAVGTVAAVEKAFAVTERRYTAHGVTFLANTAGPALPAADGVTTVVGLNTLQHFSRQSAGRPPSRADRARTPACRAPAPA